MHVVIQPSPLVVVRCFESKTKNRLYKLTSTFSYLLILISHPYIFAHLLYFLPMGYHTLQDCKIVPPNISEEFSNGDLVCADCGLVLGDRIVDTRSEWRTFANDEGDDPSRVGSAANPLLNGPQLDTVISQRDGGSGAARELNRTHGRVTAVKGERNLLQAYKDISAMCEAIGLPKLIGKISLTPPFFVESAHLNVYQPV